jgi:RNA polymerase sigma-70 factor (ECF subfamily)
MAGASVRSALSVDLVAELGQVAGGDRDAFRRVYDQAGPRMFAICLRMMGSRDLAEDVMQEVFVRVWERSWQYDPGRGEAMAWLSTLTRNCALDRLRRTPRAHVAIDEGVTEEVEASLAQLQPEPNMGRDLRRCLMAMREDYRSAVVLAYVNGFTHDELAERLGKPVGTVKSWVRRGLGQLRECMDQ